MARHLLELVSVVHASYLSCWNCHSCQTQFHKIVVHLKLHYVVCALFHCPDSMGGLAALYLFFSTCNEGLPFLVPTADVTAQQAVILQVVKLPTQRAPTFPRRSPWSDDEGMQTYCWRTKRKKSSCSWAIHRRLMQLPTEWKLE